MSTRSPMNKRSQDKLQGNLSGGMARKSASSAKPARAAAGSVRVVHTSGKAKRAEIERGEDLSNLTKEEKKARKAERRRQEDRIYTAANILMREDPDYSRRRRVWWVLLAIGILALVAVWGYTAYVASQGGSVDSMRGPEMVLIGISYAAILGALFYDFMKVRPIRNTARATAESMSESKLSSVLERTLEDEKGKKSKK